MVIASRKNRVYYPKACLKLREIETEILQIVYENGISDQIMFPITSTLNVFDGYDDIKKEYLVDFSTAEEDIIVFNPEYLTVIKDYNNKYMQNIKDQKFFYIQKTLAYTTPERKDIKEDLVLGVVILNPTDAFESWKLLATIANQIGRSLYQESIVYFKNNGTIEISIDGVMVGYAKNESAMNNIMEVHFSLTDIYTILNKMK